MYSEYTIVFSDKSRINMTWAVTIKKIRPKARSISRFSETCATNSSRLIEMSIQRISLSLTNCGHPVPFVHFLRNFHSREIKSLQLERWKVIPAMLPYLRGRYKWRVSYIFSFPSSHILRLTGPLFFPQCDFDRLVFIILGNRDFFFIASSKSLVLTRLRI